MMIAVGLIKLSKMLSTALRFRHRFRDIRDSPRLDVTYVIQNAILASNIRLTNLVVQDKYYDGRLTSQKGALRSCIACRLLLKALDGFDDAGKLFCIS